MDTNVVSEPSYLADLARVRAQTEAMEWSAMVSYRDHELARIDALESPLRRIAERAGLTLEIAHALGLSEAQVFTRLAAADRVAERAPRVWAAFCVGRIDAQRVQAVASTLDVLEREDSWDRLAEAVVDYAPEHTVAELRAWLRRFVTRTEADLAVERAEAQRERRHVDVTHVDDGMAWISAYVPSHVAAAIEKRLVREARALGTADGRTKPQRMADLFASWLTTSDVTQTVLSADVAVMITAEALTAESDGFAAAADGSWAVPASWIADEIDADQLFWHRMLIEPLTGDVLAHQYVGRFAPELLAKAIAFRDRVCRAPGCRVPADRCDLDHREPWPTGATSGDNMWALCRRHHGAKGHRVLQWILPSGHTVPTDDHCEPPVELRPVRSELARLVLDPALSGLRRPVDSGTTPNPPRP